MTSLDKWTDFFRNAGLPRGVANTYAHSFTENRIQMSMLPDLNKEYLREMGIFRMGDIILILRQAKTVQERGETSVVDRKRKVSDESEDEKPVVKKKVITLSDRMRSDIKPIIRKEMLSEESDEEPVAVKRKIIKEPQRTTLVLKNSINDREVPQRLSTSNKAIKRTIDTKNSSIFDRLGSKSAETVPKTPVPSITTSSAVKNQRVLLVKKVPAKAYESSNESDADMTDDESDYINTSHEKSVSFSAQDEIIEIASQKKGILKKKITLQPRQQQTTKIQQKQNIKARLGLKSPVKNASQALAKMRLQQSPRRQITTNKKPVVSSLKSDEILMQQKKNKSVHERLFDSKPQLTSNQGKKLSSGIGVGRKVTLNTGMSAKNGNSGSKKQNSVFDRLGFNKR